MNRRSGPIRTKSAYQLGYCRAGPSQLCVNTGTGYWLFPFRLGMTPEITEIELRRR
jgi:predicted MPP superfamily phosphohydrolase